MSPFCIKYIRKFGTFWNPAALTMMSRMMVKLLSDGYIAVSAEMFSFSRWALINSPLLWFALTGEENSSWTQLMLL